MFSGVALVAKNGVPVFYKAYGMADRAGKIPNTVRTRFNIGSINKTFTQVAIAQLIREGRLANTDTLGKLFPDYPQEASRAATVEQLLTHRAGLADFFGARVHARGQDAVSLELGLLSFCRHAAAHVRARHARSVLQRLLHRAWRDHRTRLGHAGTKSTSPSTCSDARR